MTSRRFWDTRLRLEPPINANSVIFEFGRQLAQLRETNSISETAFAKLARKVMEWLNGALKNLRQVAATLDSEGSAFEGTALQGMVLQMEKEMRALNDRMSRMLAAEEEVAGVDPYFTDPVIDALIEMGGIISRSTAQRRWTKEKFEANKSQWEDAPKLRNPKHNKIYNPDSGISPDEATRYLINQGLLPEGSTTSDMWAVVAGAAKSAARAKGHMARPRVTEEPVPETPAPRVLHARFHDVTPADMQAMNWFVEKEIWSENQSDI
jgi:hypothetical protein